MPPRVQINREMILGAAFDIARSQGEEAISARAIAARLGCSTQPVIYHFGSLERIRQAVYEKADAFHSVCLAEDANGEGLLAIGLNYIRFAARERPLFRLLFQSNEFRGKSLLDLLDGEDVKPLLLSVGQMTGLDARQAREAFLAVFLFVHGYASMFANNEMAFDEALITAQLQRALMGAVYAAQGEGV